MNRKIDNLGRLVLPKEMRKQLEINECDPVNIECTGDKIIITKPDKVDFKERIYKAIEITEKIIEEYKIIYGDKESKLLYALETQLEILKGE